MKQFVIGTVMLLSASATSFSQSLPTVPPTAKPLDGKAIAALMSFMRGQFTSYQGKDIVTGEIIYNLKKKAMLGTYDINGKPGGIFRGKVTIVGNTLCKQPQGGKKTCNTVARDKNQIYEVAKSGDIAITTILPAIPAKPSGAKPLTATEVFKLVDGKRIFVTLYDIGVPLVADVKWNLKKQASQGKYILGGTEEGKANAGYIVKNDTICFPDDKGDNCYVYLKTKNGFHEYNGKGKLHAVSIFK
jgi:hypothetical protein